MTPSTATHPFSPSLPADAGSLIRRFAEAARPILLDHFTPNCCIGATAVTIKVFRALGVKAQPLTCRLLCFNSSFIARAEAAGHLPHTPDEIKDFVADGVSWSVGTGLTDSVGHLVAILPDHNLLIDSSIEQINRPLKNIVYPPVLILETTRAFCLGRSKAHFHSESGLLIYEPFHVRRWRNAPDWIDSTRHAEPVQKILEAIRTSAHTIEEPNDERD